MVIVLSVGKITFVVAVWAYVQLSLPNTCVGKGQTESGCAAHAQQWIQQLDQPPRNDVLIRNTQSDCALAAKWMRENAGNTNEESWKRMCTDSVLMWTHKKCIYYRDDIYHESYEPC